ncbi:MAG: transglycosylase domain-containing protein [Saprospiraceae bacterium]|jgi:penicillin-binding protein 1A|nr:transglycosylase domain-containing protein [Saprospiraceae bacterium]
MFRWREKSRKVYHELSARIEAWLQPLMLYYTPVQQQLKRITEPVGELWHQFVQQYPVAGRWITRFGVACKWLFILVFSIVLFSWLGFFGKMPSSRDLRTIETPNASEVYTADSVMIGKYYTENRTTIKLDSISPYLITALLAIEDKRFFEHSGIDLRSWLRVFKGLATNSQSLGGGSTLSQQLAKNLYPRKNYFVPGVSIFINKVRENIISIKLENIYNKEELLILYLNTVPFGGNRFGIQEASRYFFNKKPKELDPGQAATLIGMLKATTALDPTRNPNNSQKRRNLVLSQMLKNKDFRFESEEMQTISKMIRAGAITDEQYQTIIATPVGAQPHEDIGSDDGVGTYFREYLRTRVLPGILEGLQKENGKPYNLYTDGLKIYTTLDSRMQKYGEEAVYKHMGELQMKFEKHWNGYTAEKPWGDDQWIDDQVKKSDRYARMVEKGYSPQAIDSAFLTPVNMKVFSWQESPVEKDTLLTPLDSVRYYFTLLNCGFMAVDHTNGQVRSWVGGTDFRFFKYDHILSKRQVGSAFKPVVYAAALMDSVQPCDFYPNKVVTVDDWTPQNSDGVYGGYYSVLGGLVYSSNVIAAQLIERVGIQRTIDLAREMGVSSEFPFEYGISLGSADISLFDMMKVFGTIANKGSRNEPVSVLKILDRYGNVIYDHEAQRSDEVSGNQKQILPEEISGVLTRMMQSVIIYGTGNPLRSQYCPAGDFAGKTGTAQNHSDGWFLAFNPTILTGAWVGGPSPAVRFRTMDLGSGSATALPIVGHFWKAMHEDADFRKMTEERLQFNPGVQSKMGCPLLIPFPPDTLQLLMADTLFRDSIRINGYKNLEQLARQKFGISVDPESTILPESGISGENNPQEGNVPQEKKPENKPIEPAINEERDKAAGNKAKNIPKKGNG